MSEEAKLKELIQQIREIKSEVETKDSELKKLKEELRVFMIDSGIREFEDVEINRVFYFDLELFRLEKPELFERYAERQKITSFKNVITKANKDKIRKDYPELYKDYIEEKTARLKGL